MIQQMKDGSNPDLFANTRWSDKIFRSAPIQTHHLSMSGGNATSHYMGVGRIYGTGWYHGRYKY